MRASAALKARQVPKVCGAIFGPPSSVSLPVKPFAELDALIPFAWSKSRP